MAAKPYEHFLSLEGLGLTRHYACGLVIFLTTLPRRWRIMGVYIYTLSAALHPGRHAVVLSAKYTVDSAFMEPDPNGTLMVNATYGDTLILVPS
jgi:hypothetical protein